MNCSFNNIFFLSVWNQ